MPLTLRGRGDSGRSPRGWVWSSPVLGWPGSSVCLGTFQHGVGQRGHAASSPGVPQRSPRGLCLGENEGHRPRPGFRGQGGPGLMAAGAVRGRRPGCQFPLGMPLTVRLRAPRSRLTGRRSGGTRVLPGASPGLLALSGHSASIRVQGPSLRCNCRGPATPGNSRTQGPTGHQPSGAQPLPPNRPWPRGCLAQ